MFSRVICSLPSRALTRAYSQRVLPKEIKHFQVNPGVLSDRVRGNPEPQLICDGGDAQNSKYHPKHFHLYNIGPDPNGEICWMQVIWYVSGKVEVRNLRVSFEGWSGPEDEYVRSGSQVVRYELHWVKPWARFLRVVYSTIAAFLIVYLFSSLLGIKKPQ